MFGVQIDEEMSRDVHAILGDKTVKSVKVRCDDFQASSWRYMECVRRDDTSFELTRRHGRFRKVLGLLQEAGVTDRFSDDFFIDLVGPANPEAGNA